MSAQTRYAFNTPTGAAGGIVDLAPYAIDTFLNEEESGKLVFGIGVVNGTKKGTNIKVPATGTTAADFAGVTTNNRTTEYDLEGKIHVRHGAAVGVMKYGRIYGRVVTDVKPAYGDALYLQVTGDEAGYFTNAAGEGTAIAIKGRFLGGVDTSNQVAQIELYNQAQA